MLDFLIILLFAKIVLLTPEPVNIKANEKYIIKLEKPISAITDGASIQIDITDMFLHNDKADLIELRKLIKKRFPRGSIQVKLMNQNKNITLNYDGMSAINAKNIRLLLNGNDVVKGDEFDRVDLKSDYQLQKIKIYWKNYQH